MKIKEINAKNIIVKTNLPDGDFVINPYTGCNHNCLYCYARFMKRFTNHPEPWGEFVDVKINAPELIPQNTEKYKGRSIVIGSVTDPYMPIESKYKITRSILERLIPLEPQLDIITKSDLVLRDLDLLKQFNDCTIAVSASFLDENVKKELEPYSPTTEKRLDAIKTLHENNIHTAIFISPIFPELTDWKKIVDITKEFTDEYWFENLNLYPSIKNEIYRFLKKKKPELVSKYYDIYSEKKDYWSGVEKEIEKYCKENNLNYKIYFHHNERSSG